MKHKVTVTFKIKTDISQEEIRESIIEFLTEELPEYDDGDSVSVSEVEVKFEKEEN